MDGWKANGRSGVWTVGWDVYDVRRNRKRPSEGPCLVWAARQIIHKCRVWILLNDITSVKTEATSGTHHLSLCTYDTNTHTPSFPPYQNLRQRDNYIHLIVFDVTIFMKSKYTWNNIYFHKNKMLSHNFIVIPYTVGNRNVCVKIATFK